MASARSTKCAPNAISHLYRGETSPSCPDAGTPSIEGVSPNEPLVVNAQGGAQARSPYSFIASFPHRAVLAVAKVVRYGLEKYAPDNWRNISQADHLNHALTHIFAYAAGDRSDAHLEHAACRLLMALETR